MPDFLTLGLNQRLVSQTLVERNRPQVVADPYFTTNTRLNLLSGLLQNRLSAESVLVAQGGDNARQANTVLPNASSALERIDLALIELDELAARAAEDDATDVERALLDIRFRSVLDRLNGIAERTEEDGINVLAGSNDFSAANIGADIGAPAGIASITFDDPATGNLAAGDGFTIAYDATAVLFTLTNTATGRVERVEGPDSAPEAGDTDRIFFTGFGIVVTVDENFDPATDIEPATDDAGFDVAGTLVARRFDVQVGTRTEEGDSVPVSLEPVFAGELSADLRTTDLLSAANAGGARTAIAEARQALSQIRGMVSGIQQQLGEVSFESGRNEGVLRDAAAVLIRQADQRRELFKILSGLALGFVVPGLTEPLRTQPAQSDPFQIRSFAPPSVGDFPYLSSVQPAGASSSLLTSAPPARSPSGLDVFA
ncbi:MAG: hypothetical protein WD270_00525 [Acetobacterales bacterium]